MRNCIANIILAAEIVLNFTGKIHWFLFVMHFRHNFAISILDAEIPIVPALLEEQQTKQLRNTARHGSEASDVKILSLSPVLIL